MVNFKVNLDQRLGKTSKRLIIKKLFKNYKIFRIKAKSKTAPNLCKLI